MDVVIDHTSLHSLSNRKIPMEYIGKRSREIMQFVELYLLSGNIWLIDKSKDLSKGETTEIYNMLSKNEMTINNKGKIGIYNLNINDLKKAHTLAAPLIFESLNQLKSTDWKEIQQPRGVFLRPGNMPVVDIEKIARIPYGSDRAEEFIHDAFSDWGDEKSTSAVILMNSLLYDWVRNFYKEKTNYGSHSLSYINTIIRWKINEKLASFAKFNNIDNKYISRGRYAPAHGRAILLKEHARIVWKNNIEKLDASLLNSIKRRLGKDSWNELITFLGPTLNSELPFIGLWFLHQLPRNPSLETLFEYLNLYKDRKEINVLRKYLSDEYTDDYEIQQVSNELNKKLGYKHQPIQSNIRWIVSTRFPFLELKTEKQLPEELLSIRSADDLKKILRRIGRRMKKTEEATLLFNIIKDFYPNEEVMKNTFEKMQSIINS